MARPDVPRDTSSIGASTGGTDAAPLERLAYEEGKRALADQTDELNGIRNRAVSYMAFVGSATAFLVGTGLKAAHRDAWFYSLAVLASAASLSTLALISLVLSPYGPRKRAGKSPTTDSPPALKPGQAGEATPLTKQDLKLARQQEKADRQWSLSLSPRTLVEKWISGRDVPPTESMMLQRLALTYDDMIVHNDHLLSRLRLRYVNLIVAGGFAVLVWAWLVWIRA